MSGRPRKAPSDDPRVERRRAQYRNYQNRKHGRPEEPVPPRPLPAKVIRGKVLRALRPGQAIIRHAVTGDYVRVTLR